MKSIAEVKYPGALQEMIDAYQFQQELEAREERLNKDKEKLKEMLAKLADTQDRIFSVTDMRMVRHVDTAWVKENEPELYRALAHVTGTDIGKIMTVAFGGSREKLNEHLKELDKTAFETYASISTGDMEKLVGKAKMKKLEGTGVRVTASATAKTKIIIKHPELLPPMPRAFVETDDGEYEEW